MISNKLYLRLLVFFVALLGVAQFGWVVYFLTPKPKEERPKLLVLPRLAAPVFQYTYWGLPEDEGKPGWREVEVPAETARKILRLIRGAKTLEVAIQEFVREHPEAKERLRRFCPNDLGLGTLAVYDDDAENPTLKVQFLNAALVRVTDRERRSETYVIRTANRQEVTDLLTEIKWGPDLQEAL